MEKLKIGDLKKGNWFSVEGSLSVYEVTANYDHGVDGYLVCHHTADIKRSLTFDENVIVGALNDIEVAEHKSHDGYLQLQAERKSTDKLLIPIMLVALSAVLIALGFSIHGILQITPPGLLLGTLITMLPLAAFFAIFVWVSNRTRTTAKMLLGFLAGLAVAAIGYWIIFSFFVEPLRELMDIKTRQ